MTRAAWTRLGPIPFLLMACIIGLSVMLWQDFRKYSDIRTSGKVLAKVDSYSNVVQRKFSHRMLWIGIETGTKLYHLDKVRTGSSSGAVIKFNNDTQVDMSADSMIVITQMEDEMILELIEGEIKALSKKGLDKLKIKTKKHKISMTQFPLKASISVNRQTVDVLQGAISIQPETYDKQKSSSMIEVSKGKSLDFLRNTKPIDTKPILKSTQSPKPDQQKIPKLETTQDKADKFSGKVTLLSLLKPQTNVVVKIKTKASYKVRFSWRPVKNANRYVFELRSINKRSTEKKFINGVNLAMIIKTPGKYQWKVYAINKNNKKIASSLSRSFTVVPLGVLPAPKLLPPVQ